jgi:hypothetical protein
MDYKSFYQEQAGGRIDPYVSYRILPSQKGAGFFGRLIKGTLWPLIKSVLPYAKEKTLSGVSELVTNLQAGKPLKESGLDALKKTGKEMFSDATREINHRLQKGGGMRKRRRRRGKTVQRKRAKSTRKTRTARKRTTRKCRKRTVRRALLFP